MKYIKIRNKEPKELAEYRDGTPGVTYSDLGKERKDIIRNSLLEEQGYICAYCMGRIDVNSCTIEHYISQTRHDESPYTEEEHKKQSLLYSNMYGVCENDGKHCDKSRGNTPLKILNPHQKNCEELVTYGLGGDIKSTGHEVEKVDKDILTLGLNCNTLLKARKAVWRDVWNRFNQEHKKEEWTKELFLEYAEKYRTKERRRKGLMFHAYCNYIAWYFEYYANNFRKL